MGLFKDSKEKDSEREEAIKKEFLADMSYKIRNPLNSICGMTEILKRNINENANKEQLLMYMDILNDAARELQQVVEESFYEFEKSPIIIQLPENVQEDDYICLYNLRVMVVEDNSVSQMVVKELLESRGSIVTFCENGKVAVDMFADSIPGTFDVIFMDIKMPIMDGYEATDKIRHLNHPQAKSIPIIAMTGEAFAEDIEMAIKSGMNAHVAKPISIEKIVSAIVGTK